MTYIISPLIPILKIFILEIFSLLLLIISQKDHKWLLNFLWTKVFPKILEKFHNMPIGIYDFFIQKYFEVFFKNFEKTTKNKFSTFWVFKILWNNYFQKFLKPPPLGSISHPLSTRHVFMHVLYSKFWRKTAQAPSGQMQKNRFGGLFSIQFLSPSSWHA